MEEKKEDKTNPRINKIDISSEMRRAYLNYSMSVIVQRALPDVRDGLKPVHRRILYAMYRLGLNSKSRFAKSAKVVGEVLGKYHPHGDMPVYDALARLAQDFSMRYPLIKGQGNFGSIDGDPPAAMRYTEVKLSKIAEEMLADIDSNTVEWTDNFDTTLKEPVVLPAKLPNLLLMGAEGIAVGMATKIPPHNLSEIVDGLIAMIESCKKVEISNESDMNNSHSAYIIYMPPDPKTIEIEELQNKENKSMPYEKVEKQIIDVSITLEEIMKHIKGPDFPTGAILYGASEIKSAYSTGKGKLLIRAKADIEKTKSGKENIIITEIPYQVNKAALIQKIAELVKEKKITGINDLRDESDKEGIRIVIELKRDASYHRTLNNLFKHTDLQTSFPVNMVALVNGAPQNVSLKTILEEYIKHRIIIIKKRSIFELLVAKRKAHILEGLLKALNFIDEIISLIKKSKTEEIAKNALIQRFNFTPTQAQAILDMQLKKLTGLEKEKIENELKTLTNRISYLHNLISNVTNILSVIKEELISLKKEYGDERKTKIVRTLPGELSDEELIENKEVIISLTKEGYIKSVPRETFKVQMRGGKGVSGFTTKEEDDVYSITSAYTHDYMLFFTDKGKVYQTRVWEIPITTRTSKGKAIVNLLSLEANEQITSVLTYSAEMIENNSYFIFMCTTNGIVKKTPLSAFKNITSRGIIAINLKKEEKLTWARLTDGSYYVLIATKLGKAIMFHEKDVRPMGRNSHGVRGILLKESDEVTSMDCTKISEKETKIIVLTQKGIGKKTLISLFPVQKRGGQGVKIASIDNRTGYVVLSGVIPSGKDTLLITSKKGQVVKIPLNSIPSLSRNAKGVILMRFSEKDDCVVSATFL